MIWIILPMLPLDHAEISIWTMASSSISSLPIISLSQVNDKLLLVLELITWMELSSTVLDLSFCTSLCSYTCSLMVTSGHQRVSALATWWSTCEVNRVNYHVKGLCKQFHSSSKIREIIGGCWGKVGPVMEWQLPDGGDNNDNHASNLSRSFWHSTRRSCLIAARLMGLHCMMSVRGGEGVEWLTTIAFWNYRCGEDCQGSRGGHSDALMGLSASETRALQLQRAKNCMLDLLDHKILT